MVVLWLFCIKPSHYFLLLGLGMFSAHLRNLTKKNFIFLVFNYFNRTFPKMSNMGTFNFIFGNVLESFSKWFDMGNVQVFQRTIRNNFLLWVTPAFALAPPSVQLRRLAFKLLPNLLLANAIHSSTPDLSRHHYTHLVPIPTLSMYIYSLCNLSLSVIVNAAFFPWEESRLHFPWVLYYFCTLGFVPCSYSALINSLVLNLPLPPTPTPLYACDKWLQLWVFLGKSLRALNTRTVQYLYILF